MKTTRHTKGIALYFPLTCGHIWRRSLLLVVCASLVGCAADPRAMVPANVSIAKKFSKSVSVAVTGGQETNPMWTSQVSNRDFATALETTIQQCGLFSRVLRTAGGDYQLDVRLIQLRQPLAGFNLTVQAEVEWRLRQVSSGKVVWQENISRSHTATMGDSLVAATRLKIGNEGAIRENIKGGLERITMLPL